MENIVQDEQLEHKKQQPFSSAIHVGSKRPRRRVSHSPSFPHCVKLSQHKRTTQQNICQPQLTLSPLRISERVCYQLNSNIIRQREVRVSGTKDYKRAINALRKIQQQSLKGMRKEKSKTTILLEDVNRKYFFFQ